MIKLETMCLQSMCEVVMEESQNFNYEEEKPLNSTRRRRGGHMQGDIERHTCSRCSKSYIHAWHLKRHTKFECGQEPRVQCPYCSAKMKQRGHVYRHIRQCHRGENVFVIDLNWELKGENDEFQYGHLATEFWIFNVGVNSSILTFTEQIILPIRVIVTKTCFI